MLFLSLLWRLPSFFDPPWVNDEGTYFAIAQGVTHGLRLYSAIWENKPPGIYLVYAAVYHSFGASLLAVRLISSAAVAGIILLVWGIGRRYMADSHLAPSSLAAGLLFGVPFLDGTTANAEVFVALFSALGVYLVLVREWPLLGGIALGLALQFKAVAGFDAIALGIWLLLNQRALMMRYTLGLTSVLALTGLLAAWSGIFHSMIRDAVLYDLGYVGHANGGTIPWILTIKVAILVAVAVRLRRAAFPYFWLAFAMAGALASGRIFGHYALQAIPALCLVLGMQARRAPTVALSLRVLVAFAVTLAALSACGGWLLAASGHDSILARRLQYYSNASRLAMGAESYSQYRTQIDDHVSRNTRVADIVKRMPPGRLLVWGNTPWVYVLSDRLPATAYTSSLRQPEVPGETQALRQSLVDGFPREVVIISPATPPLGGKALRSLGKRYKLYSRVSNAFIYLFAR
ncbi:MAG: hypothetical protein NVSMB52_08180 [Chloroflexota bacterium]